MSGKASTVNWAHLYARGTPGDDQTAKLNWEVFIFRAGPRATLVAKFGSVNCNPVLIVFQLYRRGENLRKKRRANFRAVNAPLSTNRMLAPTRSSKSS